MKIGNRADPSTIDWDKLKFMVFDVPNHTGTFGERYSHMGTILGIAAL